MVFAEDLRRHLFWLLDVVKGSPVQKHFKETKFILSASGVSERREAQSNKLKDLLNHTVATTGYYKNVERNTPLEKFPIINKNIIRDNLTDFLSSRYKLKNCVKVTTSGSTGAPFSVYQNKDKVSKNIADNLYYSSKSNYKIGSHLVYIKIWPAKFNCKMRYSFIMKNIYPCSVFNLSDSEIDNLIDYLNKSKIDICFIGYASAFEKICKHLDELDENPIRFKTQSLITISESLNSYTREALKHYFGICALSRYSNNENGIIAQQLNCEESRFRINDSSYIVEIFDMKENIKLGYGEKGRIIITDLYNKATPMIRYDTGDIGIMELDGENKQYFSEVFGRKLDHLYDTKGNLVPSHISAKLCDYGSFKQFQLVQKGLKDYEINLNTTTKVNEAEMLNEYRSYLGSDANITINYVQGIPLLASGKRREVVNEYYDLF